MNAVDTNVLIYFYDERDEKRRAMATDLITSLEDGALLWQVACEFLAASRKLAEGGLTIHTAWQRLNELCGLFKLTMPQPSVLGHAQSLMSKHQFQFWDAMIYAACLQAGITTLYSEDMPAAKIEGLAVVNPF